MASAANEVTQPQNSKNTGGSSALPSASEAASEANDKKKNGSKNISEARENYKFDREVRKLLAEGKISAYEKGEIVVKLIENGISEEEALIAAAQCEHLDEALELVKQECQLCMSGMKITEVIVSLT